MWKRIIPAATFALMPLMGACDMDMTGIGDAYADSFADCWSSMGCPRGDSVSEPISFPDDFSVDTPPRDVEMTER